MDEDTLRWGKAKACKLVLDTLQPADKAVQVKAYVAELEAENARLRAQSIDVIQHEHQVIQQRVADMEQEIGRLLTENTRLHDAMAEIYITPIANTERIAEILGLVMIGEWRTDEEREALEED